MQQAEAVYSTGMHQACYSWPYGQMMLGLLFKLGRQQSILTSSEQAVSEHLHP